MTTETDDAPSVSTGTLAALRALAGPSPHSFTDLLHAAAKQAELLRNLLPSAQDNILEHLAALIPSVLIEYIDTMPVPGISFWGSNHWHVHIRTSDSVDVQSFTGLHELKHIIDHSLRHQESGLLGDGDWEKLADHFAARVLRRERVQPQSRNIKETHTDQTSPDVVRMTGGAPLLLSVPEACDALRISRWALYQLINKRRLKTVRIDRRRFIAPADLVTFVEELRREGADDGK